MKILVEGESYPISKLKSIVSEKFYTHNKDKEYAIIKHVGYFYSFENKEVVYILPKVFMGKDKRILFDFDKDDVIDNALSDPRLKYFMLLFYRSLIEYKKRNSTSFLIQSDETIVLDTNIKDSEYSFLDIVLNIVNYHKDNQTTILFLQKKHLSNQHKKVSWERTIKKTNPLFTNDGKPIYSQVYNKKKYIDSEERLLSMFYSVLNDIKLQYKFNLQIDDIYIIYTGKAYKDLCKRAPVLLKQIKHKYFSDTLKKIYKLMELYFAINNHVKNKKKTNEYVLTEKYHIIFEDMIDKLFSDTLIKALKPLKNQKDGKEVDHIFEYDGLLDNDESIFYIGDSKYYKTDNVIGGTARYKQFIYAKNIIQFNMELLVKDEPPINEKLRYRDEITEGYNISPNFFIQGVIKDDMQHTDVDLELFDNNAEEQKHFKNRLFDRDSLFLHYYNINFLYVLKAYSQHNTAEIDLLKNKSRMVFRKTLVEYLNQEYYFYKTRFDSIDEIQDYVTQNFKLYMGRMYRTRREPLVLIIANAKEKGELDLEGRFYLT